MSVNPLVLKCQVVSTEQKFYKIGGVWYNNYRSHFPCNVRHFICSINQLITEEGAMPFFEYKCADCGAVFERLQSRDAPREGYECPQCGGTNTQRIISLFAVGKANPKSSSPSPCPSDVCSPNACPACQD